RQEAAPLARAVAGDDLRIEALERSAEALPLLQNREPRKAGLVDFERKALEEAAIAPNRKAVLPVVIASVPGVGGGDRAVTVSHPPILADRKHIRGRAPRPSARIFATKAGGV